VQVRVLGKNKNYYYLLHTLYIYIYIHVQIYTYIYVQINTHNHLEDSHRNMHILNIHPVFAPLIIRQHLTSLLVIVNKHSFGSFLYKVIIFRIQNKSSCCCPLSCRKVIVSAYQYHIIIRRNRQFILLPSIFCGVLSNQYKSEHLMDYWAQVTSWFMTRTYSNSNYGCV